MTVLLVLVMLVVFLIADRIVQRVRERRAHELAYQKSLPRSPVYAPILPDGTVLALNHTWYRPEAAEVLTVGLDDFIGWLTGPVKSIVLPGDGAEIGPEKGLIALQDENRRLEFSLPAVGRVIRINRNALRNPALALRDPYGEGWLVKLRCRHGELKTVGGKEGHDAAEWLREQAGRAKEFLFARSPNLGYAVMMDGGTIAEGALKRFDADVWKEFQERFATLPETRTSGGGPPS